ncbi:MAG: hypothetical protein SFW62_08675 [Alphaproteobacteria bacterium]|nr:hypothetical protein [Alphaproteobacteria bacterium]
MENEKKTEKLIVKIGTEAMGADKGPPDLAILGPIVDQMATLKKQGHRILHVASGAVGIGRALVSKMPSDLQDYLDCCDPIVAKQIFASYGQHILMGTYQQLLQPHNMLAAQALVSQHNLSSPRNHSYHTTARAVTTAKAAPHTLPIINENDTTEVTELMYTDNDGVAGLLACITYADRLIVISTSGGVYDRNPDQPGARLLSTIDANKWPKINTDGKSGSGTGGMKSKLDVIKKWVAPNGIITHIIGPKDSIMDVLEGKSVGTTILPKHQDSAVPARSAGANGRRTILPVRLGVLQI